MSYRPPVQTNGAFYDGSALGINLKANTFDDGGDSGLTPRSRYDSLDGQSLHLDDGYLAVEGLQPELQLGIADADPHANRHESGHRDISDYEVPDPNQLSQYDAAARKTWPGYALVDDTAAAHSHADQPTYETLSNDNIVADSDAEMGDQHNPGYANPSRIRGGGNVELTPTVPGQYDNVAAPPPAPQPDVEPGYTTLQPSSILPPSATFIPPLPEQFEDAVSYVDGTVDPDQDWNVFFAQQAASNSVALDAQMPAATNVKGRAPRPIPRMPPVPKRSKSSSVYIGSSGPAASSPPTPLRPLGRAVSSYNPGAWWEDGSAAVTPPRVAMPALVPRRVPPPPAPHIGSTNNTDTRHSILGVHPLLAPPQRQPAGVLPPAIPARIARDGSSLEVGQAASRPLSVRRDSANAPPLRQQSNSSQGSQPSLASQPSQSLSPSLSPSQASLEFHSRVSSVSNALVMKLPKSISAGSLHGTPMSAAGVTPRIDDEPEPMVDFRQESIYDEDIPIANKAAAEGTAATIAWANIVKDHDFPPGRFKTGFAAVAPGADQRKLAVLLPQHRLFGATEATSWSQLTPHCTLIRFMGNLAGGPQGMVCELAPLGGLGAVVRRVPAAFTFGHQLAILQQVGLGMSALVADRQLHRNIVLDNLLLFEITHDPRSTVVKLGGFRLLAQMGRGGVFEGNEPNLLALHPVRHMAPEAVRFQRFSEASDVWMFGMTGWELMSDGERPHSSVLNDAEIAQHVASGAQPAKPRQLINGPLWTFVSSCLDLDPSTRPTFRDAMAQIQHLGQVFAAAQSALLRQQVGERQNSVVPPHTV